MEHIPHTTKDRYPQYIRVLRSFKSRGKLNVTSHDIAKEMNIGDTSVRRDLSFLGKLGRQGLGYDVDFLLGRFINEVVPNEREDISDGIVIDCNEFVALKAYCDIVVNCFPRTTV